MEIVSLFLEGKDSLLFSWGDGLQELATTSGATLGKLKKKKNFFLTLFLPQLGCSLQLSSAKTSPGSFTV